MEQRPPIWLITVLVLQSLFALALLVLGVSLFSSSSNGIGRISVGEILLMAMPLAIVLGLGCLAWWLWMSGWRKLGGAVALTPFIPVLLFIIVFGLAV